MFGGAIDICLHLYAKCFALLTTRIEIESNEGFLTFQESRRQEEGVTRSVCLASYLPARTGEPGKTVNTLLSIISDSADVACT